MKKIISFCKHFFRSLRLLWDASPFLTVMRVSMEIISVCVPILSSYLVKLVIDILSQSSLGNGTGAGYVYQLITFIAVMQICHMVLGRVNTLLVSNHQDLISFRLNQQIIQKVNELDISFFDNPALYNEIENARRDSGSFVNLSTIIISIFRGTVQSIVAGSVLGSYGFFLPLAAIIFNIPSILVDKYATEMEYNWQRSRVLNQRKINYVQNILIGQNFSKDVRVFNTYRYLIKKFKTLWWAWYKEKRQIQRKRLFLTLCASFAPFIPTVFSLFFICYQIVHQHMTIGDFSYVNDLVMQFQSAVALIITSINSGYGSEMRLSKYDEFLAWEPKIRDTGHDKVESVNEIEFKNVSFSYPNTHHKVLDKVSFTIRENEKIALVGLNGAGKSTVVKLLLRLYEPDQGEILINHQNINEYSLDSLHAAFGVVFQDFNQYLLQMNESIAIADIMNGIDSERAEKALERADFTIDHRFSQGANTYLGKIFDKDGVVLSGGEWQKISIAQAYYKRSHFLIMDEPSSALDPEAEHNLFLKMKELCKNKGALFITHRLSCVSAADQILVFDGGKCVDQGTHKELMQHNGIYKRLFTYQADKYLSMGGYTEDASI